MSYIRGDTYIWSDGARLHIWVADGYDGWDDAVWAMEASAKRRPDRVNASGVGIPEEVMDEFVMMRVAQIMDEGLIEGAIERAIVRSRGNVGCDALVKHSERLKTIFRQIS
jgi:hypothetical protein